MIPKKLLDLIDFEKNEADGEFYSESFEICLNQDKYGLKSYSKEQTFLDSLIEFAVADGTGSMYSIWQEDDSKNIEECPIVAFGSEGGYQVVASNFDEFLQILTYDCEPMIDWESITFYRDPKSTRKSGKSDEFRNWLKNKYEISPVDDPNILVEHAQEKHQQKFEEWMKKYYSN